LMDLLFLIVVALVTTMAVPVVGSLLIFSLLIGPPAAARSFTDSPLAAMGLSVVAALLTVWVAIAVSYETNLPIGFFVGSLSAVAYAVGRSWTAWQQSKRAARPRLPGAGGSRRGRRTDPVERGGQRTHVTPIGFVEMGKGPGTVSPGP
jgi:ABC transporter family protein